MSARSLARVSATLKDLKSSYLKQFIKASDGERTPPTPHLRDQAVCRSESQMCLTKALHADKTTQIVQMCIWNWVDRMYYCFFNEKISHRGWNCFGLEKI